MSARSGFTAEAVAIILTRSGGYCEILTEGCTQRANQIHHRRPRGMGGTKRPESNEAANGLATCEACHRYCETQAREWARNHGFIVPQGADPASRRVWWRCRWWSNRKEWVWLDNEGNMNDVAPQQDTT